MQINSNIQNNLTPDEKEVFSIIRSVIEKYSPSTNAYAVGGWVRDKLLNIPSDDIDMMLSNISGEDFANLVTKELDIKDAHVIRENPEKSKHITTAKAYIPLSSGVTQEIDFAQARTEVYKADSRIPDLKPATPEEDAHRRDLTINSVFYDISTNQVVDFTGKGIKDLITSTIRTPEDPLKTFSDDPLRIFRTIRFAAKYNGKIDDETYKAMTNPNLRNEIKQKVSKERIGIEITKMLKNPNPQVAIELLKDTGLWQDIISEALAGTPYEGKMAELDMDQQNMHHKLNLWGHTFQVVKNVLEKYKEAEPEKRVTMILAALTHDLGKLYSEIQAPSKSTPGSVSYHGHEKESEEIAKHILKYLKIESYMQEVANLARYHMRPHRFTEDSVKGLRAMRRFIRQMGEKSLDWLDVLNMATSDALAKDIEIDPQIVQTYQILESKLEEALLSMGPITDTKVVPILDGNEVMNILGVKQGPWMSEIMDFVRELKDENPDITKEEAKNLLIEKFKDNPNTNIQNVQNVQASNEEDYIEIIIENADDDGDTTKSRSTCSAHLLRAKNKEITKLMNEKKYYEVASILRQLNEEYRNEKITRMAALNMFKLLLIDKKYKDNNLLQDIFEKAEKNFFDATLCSFVVGILILIKTDTEDKVIEEIASRTIKMSPGTMKSILNMLPKEIHRPELKNKFEKQLNENA